MREISLFELFRTPEENFSENLLTSAYYEIMKKVHPDSPGNLSLPEKEEISSFVNEAYKRIKDEYTRGIYEYSIRNKINLKRKEFHNVRGIFSEDDQITVLDSQKDRIGCDKKLTTQEFLDRVLSLEDEIETRSPDALHEIEQYITKEIDACRATKDKIESLVKWKYFKRLLQHIAQRHLLE
ncbi:hypothetical protein NEFER03_0088 [Nematocida sp. LUAm3]|nr:hypothetical protein NEFER03_0088 [Nematocida sp. LUAm3]KAI5173541.1 hypothetical protein NEFER02_0057 [Nematocida sp. LUAm2]KAI5176762.1 hypothetical protein NEFER01_0087 [Nematocida sp. LUAm1]